MHKTFQSKLDQIENSDIYPFHMPGHKRQSIGTPICDVYKRDITEIDGYDNLHDPKEFILEEEQFGAKLFGSEECFYLVNGSSCGILASIMSVADRPGKYLVARNCHKSVFHALYLSGKDAQYVYPEGCEDIPFNGNISVAQIEQKLSQDDYCAVIITSPTYEGIVSDVRTICEAAHKKYIPVIVDEAHGAHFRFSGEFPVSASCQRDKMRSRYCHTEYAQDASGHDADGITACTGRFDRQATVKRTSGCFSVKQSFLYFDGKYIRCIAFLCRSQRGTCKSIPAKARCFLSEDGEA